MPGPGIPPEELERVFEPFYRLESSRNRDSGGTGLGLSIARDIAQAHGGSLTLANLPAGGLEATLTAAAAAVIDGCARAAPRRPGSHSLTIVHRGRSGRAGRFRVRNAESHLTTPQGDS